MPEGWGPTSVEQWAKMVLDQVQNNNDKVKLLDEKFDLIREEILKRLENHFRDDDEKFQNLFIWKGTVENIIATNQRQIADLLSIQSYLLSWKHRADGIGICIATLNAIVLIGIGIYQIVQ